MANYIFALKFTIPPLYQTVCGHDTLYSHLCFILMKLIKQLTVLVLGDYSGTCIFGTPWDQPKVS